MPRTLIIEPPGALATRQELRNFIEEASELPDSNVPPVLTVIRQAEQQLERMGGEYTI